jgi:hypothetical protein
MLEGVDPRAVRPRRFVLVLRLLAEEPLHRQRLALERVARELDQGVRQGLALVVVDDARELVAGQRVADLRIVLVGRLGRRLGDALLPLRRGDVDPFLHGGLGNDGDGRDGLAARFFFSARQQEDETEDEDQGEGDGDDGAHERVRSWGGRIVAPADASDPIRRGRAGVGVALGLRVGRKGVAREDVSRSGNFQRTRNVIPRRGPRAKPPGSPQVPGLGRAGAASEASRGPGHQDSARIWNPRK